MQVRHVPSNPGVHQVRATQQVQKPSNKILTRPRPTSETPRQERQRRRNAQHRQMEHRYSARIL